MGVDVLERQSLVVESYCLHGSYGLATFCFGGWENLL